MRKVMQNVSVATNNDGDIVLSQEIFDLNEPDPKIVISPEQAPLLASWLLEAGHDAASEEDQSESVPIRYHARGPEADAESMSVFNNAQGMIILKIDEDTFIEIAPAMAKRLRDQLSKAIRYALTDMLRPDAES